MIYLLHGENFKDSRKKLHAIVEALLKKEPNASEFRIDSENFSEPLLEEMILSKTLFSGRYIVVADKLLSDKLSSEFVLEKLKDISKSENIFIFIDEILGKTVLSRVKRLAEKVQEFVVKNKTPSVKDFNIFSITEALGRRDKKSLWVLYQKALRENLSPEEIHGVMLWQINNILMVKGENDTKSLGLNPFVLRKSLGFASKYTREELIKLSRELVELPHDSRRGIKDFDVSLERFILEV